MNRRILLVASLIVLGSLAGTTAATTRTIFANVNTASEERPSFVLPRGHKVVGYATEEGDFALAALPHDAPMPRASATGLETTYECTNDVNAAPYGASFPLTASIAGAAVPNFASQGACTGAQGFVGPVVSLAFSTSGEVGGGVELHERGLAGGYFILWCGPAMTAAGAGAYDTWATTLLWEDSTCSIDSDGSPPSQWFDWYGTVHNSNPQNGVTRAVVNVG